MNRYIRSISIKLIKNRPQCHNCEDIILHLDDSDIEYKPTNIDRIQQYDEVIFDITNYKSDGPTDGLCNKHIKLAYISPKYEDSIFGFGGVNSVYYIIEYNITYIEKPKRVLKI